MAGCTVEVLDTEESPDKIAPLLKEAEAACYTIGSLRNPSPVGVSATVNGKPFRFD